MLVDVRGSSGFSLYLYTPHSNMLTSGSGPHLSGASIYSLNKQNQSANDLNESEKEENVCVN